MVNMFGSTRSGARVDLELDYRPGIRSLEVSGKNVSCVISQ